ncbi:MAG: 50S ribosomal protein L5 [Chloroflexi bacterium]|nr:50S ribosomal protein L5 [Chloroflexota bacterium]
MHRLKERYQNEIVPAMMKRFNYTNIMQVPKLDKIVVNVGVGEALQNAKALDAAAGDLAIITGQKPVVTKAKKSISAFRLREGNPIGTRVTLRSERMYSFFDRLVNIALARRRDFNGVSRNSFDGRGNYTLGLREQVLFVEIDYDKVDAVRGLEVTIVTTAHSDAEARYMLELLGMPFAK